MQTSDDPYERFILQQLKYYGGFTGQGSSSLQTSVSSSRTWEATEVIHSPAESTDMEEEEEAETQQGQFSFNVEKYLRTKQLHFDFEGGRPVPRLREPLDLLTIPSTSCPFQGVRWPIECEVIREKIQHIEWDPPEPESFYQQTGHERTPMPVGEEKGNVVYWTDSATKTAYFTCSRVGGSRGQMKIDQGTSRPPTLSFESRFESGNLQKAVQVGLHDYELTLRNDLYTTKHTQWFYFRVRNMKMGITYRFTIINFMKSSSLYEAGMRPLLYSELAAWLKGEGWHHAGSNIRYYRNQSEKEGRALYSLTWTVQFPYENDTCYFAHCYPYTYSDLQRYLRGVISNPTRAAYCKVRVLCRSLAGNPVYVLTITVPCDNWQEQRRKRAVVVTARVHPGETNSSWMMQGFLDFLLGDSPDASLMRETFVFKVVPMLNPDGVIVGNYRCSLAGRDLNRNYRTLLRDSFPCVWYTRNMVKRLLTEREVVLYCDLHGHSRKSNVFMYGCSDNKEGSLHLQERIFPLMMSKNAKDKFSFRSCKFKMQKSKEGTGRIVMWRLGIRNSYTMESTFGGSTLGDKKGNHFSVGDLKSMGYHLGDTLLDFCDPDQSKTVHCLTELEALLKQEIRRKLGRDVDGSLEDLSDVDVESSTSGSNSTESDGLPVHLLKCTDQNVKVKKKHLRSKKERNRLRQSSASKILHRDIKTTDTLPSNDDLEKDQIQERTPAKDAKDKGQKAQLLMGVNQSGRSWIPHPISHIGILGQETFSEDNPDRNPYMEIVREAYFCTKGLTNTCQKRVTEETGGVMCPYNSHKSQRQTQRQPLTVTTIQHRFTSLPVQQYSLLFNTDVRPHRGIKGRRTVSSMSLHRVIPEFMPTRGLEPRGSSHGCPVRSLSQKMKQERTAQATNVSLKYYSPEIQDTMCMLRTNHKRYEKGYKITLNDDQRKYPISVAHVLDLDTESTEGEQFTKQETEDFLILPDLRRRRNIHRKSHGMPLTDKAGHSLKLGKLPQRTGQQLSEGDECSSSIRSTE